MATSAVQYGPLLNVLKDLEVYSIEVLPPGYQRNLKQG